jgi:hypothetical protein
MPSSEIPAILQRNQNEENGTTETAEDISWYRQELEDSLVRIGRDENKQIDLNAVMKQLAPRLLKIPVDGVPNEIQFVYRLSQFLDTMNKTWANDDRFLVMAANATLNEQISLMTIEERRVLERVETRQRLEENGYGYQVAMAA